ncbi:hypothetical protein FSARC_12299 [Fusarium sarcochroum]|uniref:Uncharacterized protein n=1 Tax=Fusarium sarcochroum TaxID=1208366 RepID=A0A8H4T9E4_9HYPO|nr:hypothetical protein FSARC_12299 [Fusarium sarcochroum]
MSHPEIGGSDAPLAEFQWNFIKDEDDWLALLAKRKRNNEDGDEEEKEKKSESLLDSFAPSAPSVLVTGPAPAAALAVVKKKLAALRRPSGQKSPRRISMPGLWKRW